MTDMAGIPGDRICSFIERIEHIDEEIKALNEGKKEVYSEAKGEGFDVKVLKENPAAAQAGQGRARRTGVPARPVSQGHGERRLVAGRGGVAPSGDELPVLEGSLLSPRFNQPSMNSICFR